MPTEKATYAPISEKEFLTELLKAAGVLKIEDLYGTLRDAVQGEGLNEIKHDWENCDFQPARHINTKLIGVQTIENLTFLGIRAGGDWESPVFSIVYFDKDMILRGYIPKSGNIFNYMSKTAFGNSDTDEKIARMVYKTSAENLPEFNDSKLYDDIRLHFGIKRGKKGLVAPEQPESSAEKEHLEKTILLFALQFLKSNFDSATEDVSLEFEEKDVEKLQEKLSENL